MHQSPQKQIGSRREKYDIYSAWEDADAEAERRALRGAQPRARKSQQRDDTMRDETMREERGRQHPRG
jgi:hypothetical protein